jgi:murein L,D-transpeptidase YafK
MVGVKKTILVLCIILPACSATPPPEKKPQPYYQPKAAVSYMPQLGKADYVLVRKSDQKLFLMRQGKPIKSYDIALGANPIGHKVKEGDKRTPEGRYLLNYKNTRSKFYKSINIDYPNEQDIARAQARGVDPGDDIVIHGYPNELGNYSGPIYPRNWTQGCIGVRNHEMDEIWAMVEKDTPIEIIP